MGGGGGGRLYLRDSLLSFLLKGCLCSCIFKREWAAGRDPVCLTVCVCVTIKRGDKAWEIKGEGGGMKKKGAFWGFCEVSPTLPHTGLN